MKSLTRGLALAGAVCGLTLALAACGSSSSSSSSGGSSSSGSLKPALNGTGETLTGGTKGGTLTVYQHEDFEHLDPGSSYFSLDYPVVYATQRPLFIFPPNDAEHAIPDLAAGPATISDGGKTVTVHIRPNVKFSPPVNRAVTSADVAYAIERGANPNVGNAYFPAYFGYIQGADKATGGPIPGISTPEQHDDRLPPDRLIRVVLRRRAVAPAVCPGAQGVRGPDGPEEADDVRRDLRGRDRSVHAEVRLERQVPRHRLPARQVGHAGPQPELERVDRSAAGVSEPDQYQHRRRSRT